MQDIQTQTPFSYEHRSFADFLAVLSLGAKFPAVSPALCCFGIHWRTQLQSRSLATKVRQKLHSDVWHHDKTLLAV